MNTENSGVTAGKRRWVQVEEGMGDGKKKDTTKLICLQLHNR